MRTKPIVVIATLAALTAPFMTVSAEGGALEPLTYQLGISTDLNLLRDPHDPSSQLAATWKTPADIAVARETPLFRLTNTSSEASITSFTVDIRDPGYLLDAVVIAEAPTGANPILESPLDSAQGGSMSPFLTFSFHHRPLRPNESFAFWLDIDPASLPATEVVDYRQVFWDPMGNDLSDNTQVQVIFDSQPLLPAPLFDYAMEKQTYSSAQDGTTGQSLVFPSAINDETVGVFFMQQTSLVENQPLPEPSGMLLLATGLGLLALSWRRRSAPTHRQ